MNHYNCIYMFINKTNDKKYIGQAKDLKKRYKQHIFESYNEKTTEKRKYNCAMHSAIRKYGFNKFEIIILKENLQTQCLMNLYECYYIKKYNTLANNKQGYNISSGGSNGNNFIGKSEEEMNEIRKKMSDAQKGEKHWNYGKNQKKETKKKISESHKGINTRINKNKKELDDWNKKISESLNKNAKRGKEHYKSIDILQCDLDGSPIKIWNSMNEASKKLNVNLTSIWKCCNGKQNTAGGFIWKYYKQD